jgi:hypothetical protein
MRIARCRFLAGHYPFSGTLRSSAFSSRNTSFSAMGDRIRVLHLKDVPILLMFPLSPVLMVDQVDLNTGLSGLTRVGFLRTPMSTLLNSNKGNFLCHPLKGHQINGQSHPSSGPP